MYCKKCGLELEEGVKYCSNCGCNQDEENNIIDINPKSDYKPSKGWGVLGFFFPIIGLILYIVWKNDQPLNSKYAGKGALIGVIVIAVTTGALEAYDPFYY